MNPATCWPDYPGSANAPRNSRCLLVPQPEFDSDPKPHSDPDSDFDHLSLMRTFRERAGADVGEPDSAVARHAAFNSTLRRRLEIAAGLKRNSIQPSEDIVSARARCLVVPQVLQRNTEYDSTITMPDGVCMQQQKVTFLNRETLQ